MQVGSVTGLFSFDSSFLQDVNGSNVPTTGASMVSIEGSHFGHFDSSFSVRAQNTMSDRVEWTSDSAVVTSPAAGAGREAGGLQVSRLSSTR